MIWVSIIVLIVQVVIALVSYFTIHRHRTIYGIKTAVLRMPHDRDPDGHALETEHINDILNSGKYTVLQIVERDADNDLEIIMGQLKS